jgi:hypothetical protein
LQRWQILSHSSESEDQRTSTGTTRSKLFNLIVKCLWSWIGRRDSRSPYIHWRNSNHRTTHCRYSHPLKHSEIDG